MKIVALARGIGGEEEKQGGAGPSSKEALPSLVGPEIHVVESLRVFFRGEEERRERRRRRK